MSEEKNKKSKEALTTCYEQDYALATIETFDGYHSLETLLEEAEETAIMGGGGQIDFEGKKVIDSYRMILLVEKNVLVKKRIYLFLKNQLGHLSLRIK